MNILRLVAAEKEKKLKPPSAEFQLLEEEAKCNTKDKGDYNLKYEKPNLKAALTPMQYHITQDRATERAYSGRYLRMKEEGVYVCVICENPLFRSDQKYDSGCGWPSFHDVMAHGKVTVVKDTSHGIQRVEISCSQCGSHLGHAFDDGPKPTGVRYCVNSASLNFRKHTTV